MKAGFHSCVICFCTLENYEIPSIETVAYFSAYLVRRYFRKLFVVQKFVHDIKYTPNEDPQLLFETTFNMMNI